MQDDYYKLLVKRYLEKKSSADELEVFAHFLSEGKLDKYLQEAMDAEAFGTAGSPSAAINHTIIQKNKWLPWLRALSAAMLLLFLSAGLYHYLKPARSLRVEAKLVKKDFTPGTNKAILTLANGAQIDLNDVKSGLLAQQGTASVNKSAEGNIIYNVADNAAVPANTTGILLNTVSTPKGGQYQVTLPDGTHAWLNAASSIRFPTVFSGTDREVAITGEVYFEVTKNKHKPFIVTCGNQQLTVLGTHFNVNAYADEEVIKTTLLEGSVKVTNGNQAVTLKPGQQSKLVKGGNALTVADDADIEEAVAWKNGMFVFNQADIKTVMNQISRWYDVEVKFGGQLPADHYSGKISRNVNASKVLSILELSGIKFKIEGKTIIVK